MGIFSKVPQGVAFPVMFYGAIAILIAIVMVIGLAIYAKIFGI